MAWKTPKKLKGLAWKKNGRIMTQNQFYSSGLHFNSEADYQTYVKAYKTRFRLKGGKK